MRASEYTISMCPHCGEITHLDYYSYLDDTLCTTCAQLVFEEQEADEVEDELKDAYDLGFNL